MKKFFTMISLFIFLFTINVHAGTYGDYSLVINEDYSYNVYIDGNTSGTPLTDYPDIFSLDNKVLTLNEGTRLVYLKTDADITVTSNDKPVSLYYADYKTSSADVTIVFKNLRNIFSEGQGFIFIGSHKSAEIIDSYFASACFGLYDWDFRSDGKERLIIKNSTIDEANTISSYTGLDISDSTINTNEIIGRGDNLIVNKSDIKTSGIVANYGLNGQLVNTQVIDSNIECLNTNCFLGNGNGQNPSGILHIQNSTIKNYHIENMRTTSSNKSYTKIINSSFENINDLYTNNPIYIIDSDLTIGYINNTSNDVYNSQNGVYVENSKLNIGKFNAMGNIDINNSYIESDTLQFGTYPVNNKLVINNSYIRLNDNNGYNSLYNANSLSIHNSNFLAKTSGEKVYYISRSLSEYDGADIGIDDYLSLIDEDGSELSLIGSGIFDPNIEKYQYYTLSYNDETPSKSLKLISKANVTFKVKNGTWEDGTTDDITLTKDVWTKFTDDEIPKNMIGKTKGHWEVEPNTSDYIKNSVTYTYVFDKEGIVKGIIDELKENPKTGVFSYSLLVLTLLSGAIILYIRLRNNTLFKKY